MNRKRVVVLAIVIVLSVAAHTATAESLTESQLCYYHHTLWPNRDYEATQDNWRVAPYQSDEWRYARRRFRYHRDRRVPYWEEY